MRATSILVMLLAVGTVVPETLGQSLAERIAAVKQKQQLADARRKIQRDPRTGILQTLLYRQLTVSFDGTPAREVFEHLRTTLDVNLIVRYRDDAAGHGIDPETTITLVAEQLRALDVLELVLEHCGVVEPCTWQLRPSFLEVGTKERLSEARVLRAYPIDDLLYEPPRFDDAPLLGIVNLAPEYAGYGYGGYGGGVGSGTYGGAGLTVSGPSGSINTGPSGAGSHDQDKQARAQSILDLVLDVVEPTAWIQNGGSWASVAYRDGALVVYAPDFIHRKLVGYPKVPRPRPAAPAAGSSAP